MTEKSKAVFSIASRDLAEASRIIGKVVPKNPQNDIISNIFVKADKEAGTVELLASDYLRSVKVVLQADIESSGQFMIYAGLLQMANLVRDSIEFRELEDMSVAVTSDTGEFRFPITGEENSLPKRSFQYDESREVESDVWDFSHFTFKEGIATTIKAISVDEHRPALKALSCKFSPYSFKFDATDGFRIHRFDSPHSYKRTDEEIENDDPENAKHEEFILDGADAHVLSSILKAEQNMRVIMTHSHALPLEEGETYDKNEKLIYQIGKYTYYTAPVEGTYPNVDGIIPSAKYSAVFRSDDLKDLYRKAQLINSAHFAIRFEAKEEGKFEVTIEGENGSFVRLIDSQTDYPVGEDMAFNSRYLFDMLESSSSSYFNFKITASDKPVIVIPTAIKTQEEDKDIYTDDKISSFVIMPMHIESSSAK